MPLLNFTPSAVFAVSFAASAIFLNWSMSSGYFNAETIIIYGDYILLVVISLMVACLYASSVKNQELRKKLSLEIQRFKDNIQDNPDDDEVLRNLEQMRMRLEDWLRQIPEGEVELEVRIIELRELIDEVFANNQDQVQQEEPPPPIQVESSRRRG